MLDHEGMELMLLIKDPRELPHPFLHVKTQKKMDIYELRK